MECVENGVDKTWRMPDEMWAEVEPLLPPPRPRLWGGRPGAPPRRVMDAIFYVLRTGIQWKALPKAICSGSTAHKWFKIWRQAGVFRNLWKKGLVEYDQRIGLDWEWQAMDGAMTKAPLAGESTGPNPTDRAKSGTKRSLLTEGHGIPIAVAVDGANRTDMKMVKATLDNIVVDRPTPTPEKPQNMCMDKGYDYSEVRQAVDEYGYTAHIKRRGQEIQEKKDIPGYRARRWVVERTHSWMNRFRRLLIRWEKDVENYVAMLHLACAYITFHAIRSHQLANSTHAV